ncbi:MAG: Spo0B domain-containing protein [Clostridia bacterium]|nr:Spo0B domain-containing protein [Clostridia bacterium]
MKRRLMKTDVRDHVKVKKAAMFSIAINLLEIVAGVALLILVNRMLSTGVEEGVARMVTMLCVTVVGWGAFTDIGASITSLRLVRKQQELEEAYAQLEALNRDMRAQRHDFMNHLQVVYSLIEMNEPGEAMGYMDKVYGDMQRVSRMLRTACPAVNALIQAKTAEAEERGAQLRLSVAAKWDDELMPAWEICRVLANLIDNALDAACAAEHPQGEQPMVELVLGEDLRSWFFSVRNNGEAISEEARKRIFEPGFTTKKTGQGMGLYIVSQTVAQMGGRITVESHEGDTVFSGFIPRKRLSLADGNGEKEEKTTVFTKKNDKTIN